MGGGLGAGDGEGTGGEEGTGDETRDEVGDIDDRTAGPFGVQLTASRRTIATAARISGETWRRPGNYAPSTLSASMAVDLDRLGRANLKEVGDNRIDDVLSFIDRRVEHMPSDMALHRPREAQQRRIADL